MITETISITELIYTSMGAVCFTIALYALVFFVRRVIGLASSEGSPEHRKGAFILGLLTVTRHFIKAMIQFGFLVAGAINMTLPPANPDTPVTTGGVITVAAILAGQAWLTTMSILDMWVIVWYSRWRKDLDDKNGRKDTMDERVFGNPHA